MKKLIGRRCKNKTRKFYGNVTNEEGNEIARENSRFKENKWQTDSYKNVSILLEDMGIME